ncbi:hypothetical protein C8R44DRAFT_331336 [Mycena epipterygia]|nr:hypothetical protein C8R44DRAFT_331336 [Mycena epipterygia]
MRIAAEDALRDEHVKAQERVLREEEESEARMAAEEALRSERLRLETRERKVLEDEGKIRTDRAALVEDFDRTVRRMQSTAEHHRRLSEPTSKGRALTNGSRIEDHDTGGPTSSDSPSPDSPPPRKRTRIDSGSSDNVAQSSGDHSVAISSTVPPSRTTRSLRRKPATAAGTATAESLINPTTPTRHSSLFTPAPDSTNDVDMDGGMPRGRHRRGRSPMENEGVVDLKPDDANCDTEHIELGRLKLPQGRRRLEPGTLVWAKAKSFPWWPAAIYDDRDKSIPPKVVQTAMLQRKQLKGPLHIVRFYGKAPSWDCLPLDAMRALGEIKALDLDMRSRDSTFHQNWKGTLFSDCQIAYDEAMGEMESDDAKEKFLKS